MVLCLHLLLTFSPFFRALASLIRQCLFVITAVLLVCVLDNRRAQAEAPDQQLAGAGWAEGRVGC